VVVTLRQPQEEQSVVREVFGQRAEFVFLTDLRDQDRLPALQRADAVLAFAVEREFRDGELEALSGVRLLQLVSAGADHVPFRLIPSSATIASNVGGYAEPMAEHVLAMVLALAKRLFLEHRKLAAGHFDQSTPNRMLRGGVCGILGFGGIGRETARLMRAVGMRIHAINSTGRTGDPTEFIGTLEDLEKVLRASDVLVVCLPLKRSTRGLLGSRELSWMKPGAILVNVGRGDVIREADLYDHLRTHPEFMAGIDAWWTEPLRHGEFSTRFPFLELPNVIGSPHNSGITPGSIREGQRRAAENLLRFLSGGEARGIVRREEYL
jgi:phosphoglycerate dehydrogenase-like enzyme